MPYIAGHSLAAVAYLVSTPRAAMNRSFSAAWRSMAGASWRASARAFCAAATTDIISEMKKDGTLAKRSPGSTLKQFDAPIALQNGVITPQTRVFDPGKLVLEDQFGTGQTFTRDEWWQPEIDKLAADPEVF